MILDTTFLIDLMKEIVLTKNVEYFSRIRALITETY
jgi:predicted nucleic acid-binding protein